MLQRQTRKKIKVVLDINVLVSALFFPRGKPKLIWQLVESGKIASVSCDPMLDKLLEVIIRPKFDKYALTFAEKVGFVARVRYFSSVVKISAKLRDVTGDPEDDIVLACAVQGSAKYLITGDPHLKQLGQYGEVEIVTPNVFLQRITV